MDSVSKVAFTDQGEMMKDYNLYKEYMLYKEVVSLGQGLNIFR